MFTLFYSGEGQNSNITLARYVGGEGFLSPTGETVSCQDSNRLVSNPFVGKEKRNLASCGLLASCFGSVVRTRSVKVQKTEDVSSVEGDVEEHKRIHDKCANTTKNRMVLYGVGSGAPTTFVAMATCRYDDVALVILESCYHSKRDTYGMGYKLLSSTLLAYYSRDEISSPSSYIKKFPKGVPIAFVTSKKDIKVDHSSTTRLAQEMANRKSNSIYLLTLDRSTHGNYTTDDKSDISNYMIFVNALYEKYGAPYERCYSTLGRHILDRCLVKPKG
jgi:hypothetical protein